MDKGQRKRVADIGEKLGVGLFLAVLVHRFLLEEITFAGFVFSVIVLGLALLTLAVSVFLSKEG